MADDLLSDETMPDITTDTTLNDTMVDENEMTVELHEMELQERFPLDNIELSTSSSPSPKITLSPLSITINEDAKSDDTNHDNQPKFASDSDFEIFAKQITSEVPLHRLVAIKRMIKSCPLWSYDAITSSLPGIKEIATDKEMVIRQATAETLGPLAKHLFTQKQAKAHITIIHDILPMVIEMLKDSMEVRQCARLSLITIAPLLTSQQITQHIIKIVCDMAHFDNHDHKITALQLLGNLAPIIQSNTCQQYLMSELINLSADYSFRVKKTAVQQYGAVCSQLTNTAAETSLLPIFVTLCNDSIWSVRKECAEAILDVSAAISHEKKSQLISVMQKFLNDSSRWVRNSAYQILGKFISSLNSAQISREFLKYFTSIPHLSSVIANADCTNHCAFNFPAVVLTVGKKRWDELNETFQILCKKNVKCRKTLACSIHEIAAILGRDLTEKYLAETVDFFFQDDDDIREGIIQNFCKILGVFSMKSRVEYVSMLWKLASEPDTNWRFRLYLSTQLHEILKLYTMDAIKQEIIPLIFQLCQDRMADVRYAAVYPIADAINILLSDTSNDYDTNLKYICTKIESIYDGRTYSKRLLYIRIAETCFSRIDNELFDKIFLDDVLNYRTDSIFNVRFALARFIHNNLLHGMHGERYKDDSFVRETIEILKNDTDDVEVKRFFMSDDEIESWLRWRKQERDRENKIFNQNMMMNNQSNKHMTAASISTDLSSTDSSVYTSSDSDQNDDEEDSISMNDNLKSVSDQLLQISDNLSQNKLKNMDIASIDSIDHVIGMGDQIENENENENEKENANIHNNFD